MNFNIGLFLSCKFTTKLSAGSVIGCILLTDSILFKLLSFSTSTLLIYPSPSNVTFTLINLTLTTGDAVPTNPRNYIKEEITEEVYNNITLDISKVNNQVQGNYEYFIKYNGTIYKEFQL